MRIPIRTKLAAALAVPLVALVGGAAFEVVQASDDADEAVAEAAAVAAETELATAAVGPGSLIGNLQLERNISGVEQLDLQGSLELPVANSAEARAATDTAIEDLRTFVADRGARVEEAFAPALAAIDDLTALRGTIDASTALRGLGNATFANQVFDGYTSVIEALLDSTSGVALGVDDAELRTGVEIVALATRAYELRSTIVSRIILPLLVNDTSTGARTTVASLVARSDQVDEELLARSTGRFEGLAELAVLSERVVGQDALFDAYVAEGTANLSELVEQVSSTGDSGYVLLREEASAALTAAAASLQSSAQASAGDAEDRQTLVLSVATAAVLLAMVVGAFASRSITKPLRSLTGQAQAMAELHLPAAVQRVLDTPLGEDVEVPELEPIHVQTRDEVADVAKVLTTVQGAALDLALEQAVLRRNIADSFVNMSRRNQNLLDRQLQSITDLEREEADPDRLEGLFRLDHLATRMRRNAESLLRLAGGGGAETAGWGGPVPMVDVVRSALGEVEDYQRVDIKALEPATANGSVGADLAHALAELVENALAFSPPVERVEVRGRRADDGGYVLAVIDNGVGMTPDQLEVANRRLAGLESFTVAPSRYLGHYVAGHLATTHGIRIELQATPAGGITARIDVPASVLVDGRAPAAPAPAPAPVAVAPAPAPEAPAPTPELPAWPEAGTNGHHPVEDEPAPWPVAEPAPAASSVPYEDLESWLVPAPEDASSLLDTPPAPAPTDGSAPFFGDRPAPQPVADPPPAVDDGSGFGGLVARRDDTAVDGPTTASGLTKRVRGAQQPVLAPFTSPLNPAPADEVVTGPASAEEVGGFFSAFAGGVERGLAEAGSDDERRDEDGDERPAGTTDWGNW